jgi:hypothetical protein
MNIEIFKRKKKPCWIWWHTSLIPALGKLRQEDRESSRPSRLSLSQPAKTLVPSYYCSYSLYNKIRNKGKIVSAGY